MERERESRVGSKDRGRSRRLLDSSAISVRHQRGEWGYFRYSSIQVGTTE
jgi:hypothetical protein